MEDNGRKFIQPADDKLEHLVGKVLGNDAHTMTKGIRVDAHDGVVRLIGVVDTLAEKIHAEELAYTVHGVQKVDNGLSINLNPAENDGDVETELLGTLEEDPDIDLTEMGAMVRGGTAFLMGKVMSKEYEHHAIEVASRAKGVCRVVSMLEVGDGDSTPRYIPPGTPDIDTWEFPNS